MLGVAIVAAFTAGGYYAWSNFFRPEAAPEPTPQPQEPVVTTSTYASSTMGISVTYPQSFTVQDPYAYTAFEGKPISGIQFRVPASMTEGTNLIADSGVSIEQLPRARNCTGDIYLLANVRAQDVTDGGRTYSLATTTSTTTGNVYEELVYAIPGSSPCTAIRYFLHSSQIANFATGTRMFDRAAVIAAFDEIRRSLVLQPTSTQTSQ
ncbi:MAG TPA: hypothetical protein VNM40_02900 [Candidatus Paceibacterota bacterium]|nr:hypothetical protein [Candidatus Paceibacterota bacterium]